MDIEDLVVRNAEWIRMKARGYMFDKDDADDLAGETIYRCLQNASKFDITRNFKPWVKTIMENIFKTQLMRMNRMPLVSVDDCKPLSCNRSADSLVAVTRLINILRNCSRNSVNIECVILHAKGYTYKEIAQKVGIRMGTVKSRIANGRRFFGELFENS